MFVFGDGDCGQLGLGEEVTERLRPFPISVAGKKVSLGCGALEQHSSSCHQQHLIDTMRSAAAAAVPIPSHKRTARPLAQVLQVACGGMHTVALTEGNLIFSWGVNDEGALGRETGAHVASADAWLLALLVRWRRHPPPVRFIALTVTATGSPDPLCRRRAVGEVWASHRQAGRRLCARQGADAAGGGQDCAAVHR